MQNQICLPYLCIIFAISTTDKSFNTRNQHPTMKTEAYVNMVIAPDKAAYCVFTQFRGPENAIKFISVRTKTQLKSLILNSELFRSV